MNAIEPVDTRRDKPTTRRPKLLLCGTNYGASYLPVLEEQGCPFELAGILARGSERSVRLAGQKNLPLWSSVEQVADHVSAAVIALPPPAAEAVAEQLIRRSIHVLMEHPVAADVLQDLRRVASAAKVVHHVNCHFAELTAPRVFIRECRRRSQLGPVRYASVVTAARSAYATFDVLGRALAGLSGSFLKREGVSLASPVAYPFGSFRGVVGGVPARVQCSGAVGSADDGSDSPVAQRIEVGFEDGNLMLLSPVGPVVWSEKLRLELRDRPEQPFWVNIAEEPVNFAGFLKDRARANRRAIDELAQQIADGEQPLHQSTEWLSTVADLMRTVRSN